MATNNNNSNNNNKQLSHIALTVDSGTKLLETGLEVKNTNEAGKGEANKAFNPKSEWLSTLKDISDRNERDVQYDDNSKYVEQYVECLDKYLEGCYSAL